MRNLIFILLLFSKTAIGQTFFGVASSPADNGTNVANPTSVTPPGSMVSGDLVVMVAWCRTSSATLAMSATGGQTWSTINPSNSASGATLTSREFWCTYNGTWSADPSISFGATTNNNVVLLVFRPTASTSTWDNDNLGANRNISFSAPSTPFTVTITGVTPANNKSIIIAVWHTDDDNTWGTLSGTNWVKTSLTAQYRNTSGSDASATIAYQIQTVAAATNNVSQNQATLGGDPGNYNILCLYEVTHVALPRRINVITKK